MRQIHFVLFIILLVTFVLSCKNEQKKEINSSVEVIAATALNKETLLDSTLLSEENISKSLYEKIKALPELQFFFSGIKETELQKILQNKKGPYTIIALPNEVFKLPEMDSVRTQSLRDSIMRILKNHIIEDKITSIELIKRLKKTNGFLSEATLSNESITFSKEGFDLFIATPFIGKTRLERTDIHASNGILHIVDSVWGEQ